MRDAKHIHEDLLIREDLDYRRGWSPTRMQWLLFTVFWLIVIFGGWE